MDKLLRRRLRSFWASCPVSEIIALSAQLNHLDHHREVLSEAERPISGQSHCWLNFIKADYLWCLIFLYFSIILMQLWGNHLVYVNFWQGNRWSIRNTPWAKSSPNLLLSCFPWWALLRWVPHLPFPVSVECLPEGKSTGLSSTWRLLALRN